MDHSSPIGNRLAILTNGGGVGVLAIDRLIDLGGTAAEISAATKEQLDASLPPTWSRSNPIDIIGDANADRYARRARSAAGRCRGRRRSGHERRDGLSASADIARTVGDIACAQRQIWLRPKPILATWVGNSTKVAEIFDHANVPSYPTETDAIRGFMHLVRHGEVVRTLMETPPMLPRDFSPDVPTARRLVQQAVADGRQWLDPIEATQLLQCYAIPTVPIATAATPDAAAAAAAPFLSKGEAVVVKIHSRDIVHKSEVDGVRLNLTSAAAVRDAAEAIIESARQEFAAGAHCRRHGSTDDHPT